MTIMMLQTALAEANARAEEAVAQIQTEALENERRLAAELKEKLERLQTESALAQEQSKSEIHELKGQIKREQISSKTLRDELTTEITVGPPLLTLGSCVDGRHWNQSWSC